MLTKRKYVDSHWLIFAVQGAISVLFGWYASFASGESVSNLVAIIGATLLALGIIELFNLLRRTHLRETWGLSLIITIIEVAVAFLLLFTISADPVFHLSVIAGYTIIRGLFEILVGLRSVDDTTDKFIWTLIGICGVIMGFAVLNSGHQGDFAFIKYFGAYMMLYGVAELIYGVHNRDQLNDLKLERRQQAAQRRAATRSQKSTKAAKTVNSARRATPRKTAAKKTAKTARKSR